MANLVNADRVRLAFGTRTLLADVSLGLGVGEVIGVVGRNGAGKTTLLRVLAGAQPVDSGAVTRTNSLSLGALWQSDDMPAGVTVRDVVVGGRPDHAWAAAAQSRAIVTELLADVPLDSPITALSGGERRRAALAAMLLPRHDLLILDEPTNHLDVEAVSWLAAELKRRSDTGQAMLIVSHDRWFLDEICTRMWEVHDGEVDAYDGGYSAYVLARTERARQAAAAETRRRNCCARSWRGCAGAHRLALPNRSSASPRPMRSSPTCRRRATGCNCSNSPCRDWVRTSSTSTP